MLTLINPIMIALSLLLLVAYLILHLRHILSWQRVLSALFFLLLAIIALSLVSKAYHPSGAFMPQKSLLSVNMVPEHKMVDRGSKIEDRWITSSWVPAFLERKAYSLAHTRKGFRFDDLKARSNIDLDVGFNSIVRMILHLPRAAQIVFLAPFPNQWFEAGRSVAGSLMRRIAIFEMVVTYFSFMFLPYAIWYWRKNIEIWMVFIFCGLMMLSYGLVICNVGTLYRMRYPYITILIALGIAGFITLLEQTACIKRDK